MPSSTPISWWLSKLNRVTKTTDGYFAECPAHVDAKESLHLTVEGEKVLVHCFAGCKYADIVASLEAPRSTTPTVQTAPQVVTSLRPQPDQWWAEYTGVSWAEWESWGAQKRPDGVAFAWSKVATQKVRKTAAKDFSWTHQGLPRPPLWPEVPNELPDDVYITEGESDCGILRHLGFTAFGLTKGAGTPAGAALWSSLSRRGAKRIHLCLDNDQAGAEARQLYMAELSQSALGCRRVELESILDAVLGEKDLRDLWLRLQETPDEFVRLLTQDVSIKTVNQYPDVTAFLKRPIDEKSWLVDRIWLDQTAGIVVGPPKLGKSWFALDLAVSVASGVKFLGEFDVNSPGAVFYISKEDPDYLLHDRLTKILASKGLGGHVNRSHGQLAVTLPSNKPLPLVLDLKRDFVFSTEATSRLMSKLAEVESKYGHIALVIIDPLLRMTEGVDEFRASEVGSSVFATSASIQERFKAGVMMVHHQTKGAKYYGSIAFHAFSDAILNLTKTNDDPPWVKVQSEFKSAAGGEWAFRFAELSRNYAVEVDRVRDDDVQLMPTVTLTPTPRIKKTDASADEIMTILQPGIDLTAQEIADRLSKPIYQVRPSLSKLRGVGQIEMFTVKSASGHGRPSEHWRRTCESLPITPQDSQPSA